MTNALRIIALVTVIAALGSCETIRDIAEQAGDRPTASLAGVGIDQLRLDGVDLTFDIDIANPYDIDLPLIGADYALRSGRRDFLSGAFNPDTSIPARGSSTVRIPASLRFADVLAVVSGLRPGQVLPYDASVQLRVDSPVGQLGLPLSRQGELPIPAVPNVALSSMNIERLGLTETVAVLALDIENTNAFAMGLGALDYQLSLGGTRIASTTAQATGSVNPGDTQTVRIPISFAPQELGFAVFNMLTGNDASYDIAGTLDVATPYGPLRLPFEQRGRTSLIK